MGLSKSISQLFITFLEDSRSVTYTHLDPKVQVP